MVYQLSEANYCAYAGQACAAGRWQLRTADTDFLHTPMRVVTRHDRDLNDFMLALLDDERQPLWIQVCSRT
jgi:hypothetical protein